MSAAVHDDAVFSALGDSTRRRVLALIGQRGSATATELAAELPITRQGVQKHLVSLLEARLVAPSRSGREVRYRLTPAPLGGAVAWIAAVGGEWDERLAGLERELGG